MSPCPMELTHLSTSFIILLQVHQVAMHMVAELVQNKYSYLL